MSLNSDNIPSSSSFLATNYTKPDAILDDPTATESWIVAAVAAGSIFVLIMAARLCYTYMRKFPGKGSEDEHEAQPISDLINRSAITTGVGGKRGGRYSVA
ncbi:unnamed protein product, partial [Mesorhabditis spiculigera]